MGSLLNLHRKAESLPDAGTVRTEGSVRFIASPVQGALWYVFLDSSKLAKQQNNQYEYFLDTMWLNPLAWSNEEGMMGLSETYARGGRLPCGRIRCCADEEKTELYRIALLC